MPRSEISAVPMAHLTVLMTMILWGTTFVSTKVLLRTFAPVEILFIRFALGFLALHLVRGRLGWLGLRREALLAGAGLTGVTLYFFLENIALIYTPASNVGVLVVLAPFFTALLATVFLNGEKPGWRFFAGFLAALAGVLLMSLKGSPRIHPKGDLLATAAMLFWAIYSILMKKISTFGRPMLLCTRRVFLYGLLLMLPVLCVTGFRCSAAEILRPVELFNFCYLGFGASAAGFACWNWSVRILGAVKTSAYIYLGPVITAISSRWILGERLSPTAFLGILLALAGLAAAEAPRRKGVQSRSEERTSPDSSATTDRTPSP